MIGQGDGYGFHLESAFRSEAASLSRVDKANLFFGKLQGLGDLVQSAEGGVVGDPDGNPAAFRIHLRVGRVGLHGRVLDDGDGVTFF